MTTPAQPADGVEALAPAAAVAYACLRESGYHEAAANLREYLRTLAASKADSAQATPTDAARVRDAEAWRWVTDRAWFVDAAAYAFDLRFGPGDFSTEPRNADADDVREAIFAAIEEEAALAAVEGEG